MDCIHFKAPGCSYNNIRGSRCVGAGCQFHTPYTPPPKPTLLDKIKSWFK